MLNIPQLVKFRAKRRALERRSPKLSLGMGLSLLASLLMVAGGLALVWFYMDLTRDLPSSGLLPSLLEPPNGRLLKPTRIFDRSQQQVIMVLENPGAAGRQYLHVGGSSEAGKDHFPQSLVDATLVVYDPGFWKHNGYTFAGVSAGRHTTLAQRLVSELMIEQEPSSIQKNLRERILAAQVTAEFGREKILEWFLNSAQYGEMIYGADAAARVYFGKSASQLTLAESAMLTAMSQAPSINPFTGFQLLKLQRDKIIQALLMNHLVSAEDALQAIGEPVVFQPHIDTLSTAPGFTDRVLQQVGSLIPLEQVMRGGYDIVTTLDDHLQEQAACAARLLVSRLQDPSGQAATPADSQCDAGKLLPTLQDIPGISPQDLALNALILDPHTGEVLALVREGTSLDETSTATAHPAGSIISPLLYVTAFSHGMSPATLLWDIPPEVDTGTPSPGQQPGAAEVTPAYHGPVRLRTAFVNDYITAADEVLQQVGMDNVDLTLQRFGMDFTGTAVGSIKSTRDLFSQPVDLREIVQVYSVFANAGTMAGQPGSETPAGEDSLSLEANTILRIVSSDGKVWVDRSTSLSRSIVNPQLAYLVTDVLRDEYARWPSLGHPNAVEIGRPAAVKVGRSLDGQNTWTIGYIPQLAIGIWAGSTQNEPGGIPAQVSESLWHALMQYASSQLPVEDFNMPDGISRLQVCDPSGLLVSELCPAVAQEVFLLGTEPIQEDNLYQKFVINRQSGLLATVFTPSDMLEEKVYLVVPAWAADWAKKAGLPIPPDSYDPISTSQNGSPDVSITEPTIFDYVSGQVSIYGSAGGEGFSYYRLQIGQGLNPQQWLQIGQDVSSPVKDGLLGTWDTQGMEGLYVIQLLVVRQDQRVERAIIQVTIDPTPPQLQILAPMDGESIIYYQGELIPMQVSASDNLELQQVEFYVDGKLQNTLQKAPLVVVWPAQLGKHTLEVRAYDLAGNVSTASISFSVSRK